MSVFVEGHPVAQIGSKGGPVGSPLSGDSAATDFFKAIGSPIVPGEDQVIIAAVSVRGATATPNGITLKLYVDAVVAGSTSGGEFTGLVETTNNFFPLELTSGTHQAYLEWTITGTAALTISCFAAIYTTDDPDNFDVNNPKPGELLLFSEFVPSALFGVGTHDSLPADNFDVP